MTSAVRAERDDYFYWRTMLADPKSRVGMFEDTPESGFYKMENGFRTIGVAIWRENGAVIMLKDGSTEHPKNFGRTWLSCARHPISQEQYEQLLKNREPGADPIYAPLPTDLAGLLERVQRLGAIPATIETDDEAKRFADIAHVLKQIETSATENGKALVEALKAKIKEEEGPYKDLADLAAETRKPFMAAITRHLSARNASGGVKGLMGKAISLRTDKVLQITSYADALQHFVKSDPEAFSDLVEKLAREALKDGKQVPGAKLIEKRRAQ